MQLDQVIQQNASASEEMASTSEELAAQAETLSSTVAFFKLNGKGAASKKVKQLTRAGRPAHLDTAAENIGVGKKVQKTGIAVAEKAETQSLERIDTSI